MTFVSNSCSMDAVKSLQYCTFMRNRNGSRLAPASEPFWLKPQFQTWKAARNSALIMIQGNHTSRFNVKDFCVNAISLLRDSKVPVLWALKNIEQNDVEAPSASDLLKNLVSQALRLNDVLHSERSMALNCAKFQRAESESQWLELLGSVLSGLPHVYIVIDIEAINPRLRSLDASFSWPIALLNFFQTLTNQGCKTVVKAILVSYSSSVFMGTLDKDLHDLLIPVRRLETSPLAAKGRRVLQRGSLPRARAYGRGDAQRLAF